MSNDIDFIRSLIQMIRDKENPQEPSSDIHIHVGDSSDPDDMSDEEIDSPIDDNNVFIPPLQQRIEMLKKMTNVKHKDAAHMDQLDADDPAIH